MYQKSTGFLTRGGFMDNRTYGYARVSSSEQNLDRQLEALTEYGIAERDIITDKASGRDFSRPGYIALKNNMLRSGDVLVIKELDRLGRNYGQIKEEWRELQRMGVDIIILDMPLLNTKDKSSLEKSLIANIVFELLAYTAEKERQKIKARQAEGIRISREKGKAFGRPNTELPSNFHDEVRRWKNGSQTAADAMRHLGLKKNTFYRLVKRMK